MQFEISVLLRVLCVSVVVISTPCLRGGDFYAFFAPRGHGEAQRKTETASVPVCETP